MSKIEYKDIDTGLSYEGYVWMSDKIEPEILENEKLRSEWFDSCNPFVIEAQFCNREQHISYSIKTIDGELFINKFEYEDKDIKTYESNRMGGKKLRFQQQWTERKDELCKDMTALIPGALVFAGFESTKEEEETA